ncbi:MAG: alpha/beta fold hydrolase [Gammaproteobacteria bacterium]|nr:alpha/beta fold hydrolase [Gammaproteobacteria bacterium]
MLLNSQQFNPLGSNPLVVLHGLFGAQDNWRSQALIWAQDRHVITMDLRNHGMSGHDPLMDYDSMAADVAVSIDELGLEKVDLLGHSMGGKVAIQLALNQSQLVRSLVVADIAPVVYEPRHDAILIGLKSIDLVNLKSRKQALDALIQFEPDPRICQFLLKSLYKNEIGEFALRYNLTAIEKNYHSISAAPKPINTNANYDGPTLVIKGADSQYILPQHKTAFETLLPNTQLKVMAGCGHWLHAEKPELFCGLVSRFLASKV